MGLEPSDSRSWVAVGGWGVAVVAASVVTAMVVVAVTGPAAAAATGVLPCGLRMADCGWRVADGGI